MINFIIKPLMLLMIATPFVSMIVILSALWGVIGKTTYIDINNASVKVENNSKASNVLVKQTQNGEACSTSVAPDPAFDGKADSTVEDKPYQGKIDWDRVV